MHSLPFKHLIVKRTRQRSKQQYYSVITGLGQGHMHVSCGTVGRRHLTLTWRVREGSGRWSVLVSGTPLGGLMPSPILALDSLPLSK